MCITQIMHKCDHMGRGDSHDKQKINYILIHAHKSNNVFTFTQFLRTLY